MADVEIERLLKKEGSRRLAPAPTREPIPEGIGVVVPTANSEGQGSVASPLTEVEWDTPSYYQVISSDGLITIDVPEESHFQDAFLKDLEIHWRDPNL